MVYPDTPPKQVANQKNVIESITTHFEVMEQEAKNISEAMTQFWWNVVQDEKLDQLTK